MVLRKKVATTREADREALISRGGHVAEDVNEKNKKKEWINFCLRVRTDMLEQIDEILDERVGISKTGWILEAIQEKLKRAKHSSET